MTNLRTTRNLFPAADVVGNTPRPPTPRCVRTRHPKSTPMTPMTPMPSSAHSGHSMSRERGAVGMVEQLGLDLRCPVAPVSASTEVNGAQFTDRHSDTAKGLAQAEASALDRLIACAPSGTDRPTTLKDCLHFLAARPVLPKSLLGDARSAVSSTAKALGRDSASLPADPVELRPLLRSINWAAQGTSRKREANIRSALTTTLLAVGWIAPAFRPKARHTPAWQSLLALAEQHKLSGPLGPFARFCAARGVQPRDTSNEHLEAYQRERILNSLDLAPRQSARQVATAWNRAAKKSN